MDFNRIEELLAKYWECDTSLQEEEELKKFFNSQEVPEHLMAYKSLFIYYEEEKKNGYRNYPSLNPEKNDEYGLFERSARNLPDAKTLYANLLNIRDLLGYDKVILPVQAIDVINEYLG